LVGCGHRLANRFVGIQHCKLAWALRFVATNEVRCERFQAGLIRLGTERILGISFEALFRLGLLVLALIVSRA